jgi:hypothetical protein
VPTARWGLEAAPAKRAGRRTGTGDEGWHTRDERARAREVLHPQGGGLINPASRRGTFGVLPWEIGRPAPYAGLRAEGAALTDRQTSAEGIGGPPPARLVRHPTAARRGNSEAELPRQRADGPNGAPRGAERPGGVVSCRAGAPHP